MIKRLINIIIEGSNSHKRQQLQLDRLQDLVESLEKDSKNLARSMSLMASSVARLRQTVISLDSSFPSGTGSGIQYD